MIIFNVPVINAVNNIINNSLLEPYFLLIWSKIIINKNCQEVVPIVMTQSMAKEPDKEKNIKR